MRRATTIRASATSSIAAIDPVAGNHAAARDGPTAKADAGGVSNSLWRTRSCQSPAVGKVTVATHSPPPALVAITLMRSSVPGSQAVSSTLPWSTGVTPCWSSRRRSSRSSPAVGGVSAPSTIEVSA